MPVSQRHPGSIALVNYKGGVGKTTVTTLLAYYLATNKKRVLMIDIDPQCSLSVGANVDVDELNEGGHDIYEIMRPDAWGHISGVDWASYPRHAPLMPAARNVDIIKGSFRVDDLDLEIAQNLALREEQQQHELFLYARQVLNAYRDYDYILIDCPPNKMFLTQAMLRAAASFVAVTIPDRLSTFGMPRLLRWIGNIRPHDRPKFLGYVVNDLNRHGGRIEGTQSDYRAALELDLPEVIEQIGWPLYDEGLILGDLPHLGVVGGLMSGDRSWRDLRESGSRQASVEACMIGVRDRLLARL